MPRHAVVTSVVVIVLLFATTQTPAAKNTFNFFIGHRTIEDVEAIDLDSQLDFGIEMSFADDDWPVAIAVDILGSTASTGDPCTSNNSWFCFNRDATSTNVELDVGIRKTWEFAASPIHPYVGGGLAIGRGELEFEDAGTTVSDDDRGTGYWIGGGVYWRLGHRFNLGLNLRHSKIDTEVFGEDLNIGGTHVGLVLGWGY